VIHKTPLFFFPFKFFMAITQKHPYHLVDPSPWPLIGSISAFTITSSGVLWFHGYENGGVSFILGFLLLLLTFYTWWRDVIREGSLEGQHTSMVQLGLRFGVVLFIVSEVMFFVAFFWAFFWASLAPVPEIASVWPPKNIEVLSAWEVPFLNTLILLSSGATVTWAHHAVICGDYRSCVLGLISTVVLAIFFTALQVFE
jgi:hypothetical protein